MTHAPTIKLTIGTDPELVILNRDGVPINVADYASRTAHFGADGHIYLAELRPGPGVTPLDLCNNVRATLQMAGELGAAGLSWYAGPWIADKPMGGHIHFGTPLTDEIQRTLDTFGSFILPFIEPADQARIRRTTRFRSHTGWIADRPYGLVGDFREKPHGFEWRTPSSFIVNPGMTLAMFALAKALVYEELVQGPCAVANLSPKILNKVSVDPEDIHQAKRESLEPYLPVWWQVINSLTYFSRGHEGRNLNGVLQYLRNTVIPRGGFNTVHDLKKVWKISAPNGATPPRTVRTVLNEVLEVDDLTNVIRFWQGGGGNTEPERPNTNNTTTRVANFANAVRDDLWATYTIEATHPEVTWTDWNAALNTWGAERIGAETVIPV